MKSASQRGFGEKEEKLGHEEKEGNEVGPWDQDRRTRAHLLKRHAPMQGEPRAPAPGAPRGLLHPLLADCISQTG